MRWKGTRPTIKLRNSPDFDSFRDIGFIKGFLDGNWFGDPTYLAEWRYYPPLMHGLGAIGVWLSGASPMRFWVQIAPWINLFEPITFYLMNARLFGRPAAVIAAAVFELFNGTFIYPYPEAS